MTQETTRPRKRKAAGRASQTKVPLEPRSIDSILEELRGKREAGPEFTVAWKQYSPFQPEKPRTRTFMNTASIWVFAKRMIAREMRQAKGVKPKVAPQKLAMEKYAAEWDRKKEEEKIREKKLEEESARRVRKEEMLEAMLGESLELFAVENQRLKAEREEQKATVRLFRQALDAVGQVLEINRSDGGWKVQLEPWEVKRARRISGDFDSSPVIYELKFDKEFRVLSTNTPGDPFAGRRILAALETELDRRIRKPLEIRMGEAESLGRARPITDIEREILEAEREQEREVSKLCEQALEDFGRVLKISRRDDGWKVRVELFEEIGMGGRRLGSKHPLLFDLKVDKDVKVVSYEGV